MDPARASSARSRSRGMSRATRSGTVSFQRAAADSSAAEKERCRERAARRRATAVSGRSSQRPRAVSETRIAHRPSGRRCGDARTVATPRRWSSRASSGAYAVPGPVPAAAVHQSSSRSRDVPVARVSDAHRVPDERAEPRSPAVRGCSTSRSIPSISAVTAPSVIVWATHTAERRSHSRTRTRIRAASSSTSYTAPAHR
ncbi:hypothetical protein ACGFMO_05220 [Streptomyces niveus]|uniref:hypothetical protein n=1 Tax=Streptomyces niveus TaxID=193462 RepID=UPI00370FB6C7